MFAQADLYSDSYYVAPSTTESTGMMAFLTAYFLFIVVIYVVAVVAMWKIFEKAGEKGWKALIPLYNYWTLCEIVGKPGWWSLSFLLSVIPFVGWIAPLVVAIIVSIELGKAFGKDTVWSVFLANYIFTNRLFDARFWK
jgi:hypothetical protein